MMGADVTGSCLNNGLDDPNDHLLVQQQARLDDETLQLIKMLAALPEQTHYLRARRDAPHVWRVDDPSSDGEPESEAQHVLSPPNDTVLLSRKGDEPVTCG